MYLDVNEIMKVLPHRPPFLMVDRIIELEGGERCVGIKNTTMDEHFFQGHFPGHPVMPGVLIVEAMAQVACLMAYKADGTDYHNKVCYFMAIDNAKFRKPVFPGDQLRLEVTTLQRRRGVWVISGKTYVEDTLVCEADFKATLVDANQ
ncbi:3-hydroxydecanoyl-[acyl-carrier-protein] dehydratase / 3-hydroxyacyl-[acyl-carrier-protein] dehydratase [Pelobacter propionicus DSM 2379]|jgi:3-hydroxyacyl-[acyl-carrier-protein] dehydratase|uniref:3-hydroxyacyl-[acyl-carrier-protein] dehydratase FabZ n=2 Tax=Pelobacter propionicus TaxID=29543 RepID=A1AKV6_PELPD|nr:3-hydroxyacyl-ACP dehydratase FabZ [Pelobacter propionicus]ABK97976.1 3-hydroxydecanoyl-[acyl-carrier-protein] dehydratase / 3-hydroxyacyl-[acyl-carrier-protein] dehydratase [Pelobacter propionicus DSM 2379]